jgi:hypothetical protein
MLIPTSRLKRAVYPPLLFCIAVAGVTLSAPHLSILAMVLLGCTIGFGGCLAPQPIPHLRTVFRSMTRPCTNLETFRVACFGNVLASWVLLCLWWSARFAMAGPLNNPLLLFAVCTWAAVLGTVRIEHCTTRANPFVGISR